MLRGLRACARLAIAVAIVTLLCLGASFGAQIVPTARSTESGVTVALVPPTLGGSDSSASAATASASAPIDWTDLNISDSKSPPPRIDGSMVWDTQDGYGLLFGGEYLNSTTLSYDFYNDTWTYVSGAWTNVTPTISPSPRMGMDLAYDFADSEVVLFGGMNSDHDYLNDTWSWSAGHWTNITSTVAPPSGYWGSMTFDSATSSVILFGGINHTSQYGNDTWSFQGGIWTRLAPPVSPAGRHAQEMVYNPGGGEIVMFGGLGPTGYLNDTWIFSGGTWAPIGSGNHPGPRVGPGMVDDPDQGLGTVVLYGGSPAPDDYYSTWLFAGGVWTQYNLTVTPPNPTNPWGQMVYDPADRYVLLFYEINGEGPDMQSWALSFASSSPPPARLSATLLVAPVTVAVGQAFAVATEVTGGTSPYGYSYVGLPSPCLSANLSAFLCIPEVSGNFVVTVTVTDAHGSSTTASAALTVSPPATSNGSSSFGWWWIALIVVVVVAVLLMVVIGRRRRRPPLAPPPSATGLPPPPPPI